MARQYRSSVVVSASAIAAVALLCASCVTRRGPGRDYAGPRPIPAHIVKQFSRPQQTQFEVTEDVREQCDAYTHRRVRLQNLDCGLLQLDKADKSRPKQHSITLDWYMPEAPVMSPAPVIMVLPILGGDYSVSRLFALYFASKGFSSIIVHRQKGYRMLDDLDRVDLILRQMVLDTRTVLDWIEAQPTLDATRIGSFGISMGGIKNALLTALDTRIKASVLGLAGGDLPYVLTYSNEPGVVRGRDAFCRKHGLAPEQLYERLRNAIECDPLTYAEYADARNVLLIRARFDKCMPPLATQRLREKMGNPETITVLAGHYSAIVYVPYIRRRALRFFRKKLGVK